MIAETPFASFWMGGYECCDMVNRYGNRVDLLKSTDHLNQMQADYRLLDAFKMKTVREGVRWSVVEANVGVYDWGPVIDMIGTAIIMNKQILFDLCHFGWPADLSPFHPQFATRFVAMCKSFVTVYRSLLPEGPLIVTPINEVSFIAWLGGEVAGSSPYCTGKGWDLKYHLMKAFIEGVRAMKEMDNEVLILTVEPLVHIIADDDDILTQQEVRLMNGYQFQALDMLTGQTCPELGGCPEYLDLIGLDYYYNCQWSYPSNRVLNWKMPATEPAYRPLSEQVRNVYERYGKPIVLTETSHAGEDRSAWITDVTNECKKILSFNIPLWGICIYPIIDRPDWDHPNLWHRSGLWDVDEKSVALERKLYPPYAATVLQCQQMI